MKKNTVLVLGKEIDIIHASSKPIGYGHKKITVKLYYDGEYQKFTATTNNMPEYDAACELEGYEKYLALYELIENQIIDEIAEWLEDIE